MPSSLYRKLGYDSADGVIVGWVPKIDRGAMGEEHYRDGTREFICFAVKPKSYNYLPIVVDMIATDMKGVKWWLVRQAARSFGCQEVSVVWSGAAGDLTVQCLPDERTREGYELSVRRYSAGPWVAITEELFND